MESYCVSRCILNTLNLVLAFVVTDANRSRRLVGRLTRQWESRGPFIISRNSTKLSHRCDLHYLKWLFTSSTFASYQRLLFFFLSLSFFVFVPRRRHFCGFPFVLWSIFSFTFLLFSFLYPSPFSPSSRCRDLNLLNTKRERRGGEASPWRGDAVRDTTFVIIMGETKAYCSEVLQAVPHYPSWWQGMVLEKWRR
jgi:hypothetical protein